MTNAKCIVFSGLLGCALATSACTGTDEAGLGEAAELLNQTGAIDRLGERSAPRIPAGAAEKSCGRE